MTTTALIPAAGIQFVKFAIERCIRIVSEDGGERCLPVDPRQREEILAPIALNESLSSHDYDRLYLITTQVDSEFYAVMDTQDGELSNLAINHEIDDYSHVISEESYGGVVWRLVGYLSDRPDVALELTTGNDEQGVHAILGAFQSMLVASQRPAPARLVIDLTDGALQGIYSHQPVEVIIVSFDHEGDGTSAALAVKENAGKPAATWQHRDGGDAEMEAFFAKSAEQFAATA